MLPSVSRTFHGRDIFAPAAAHIANGVPAEEFGPKITDVVRPDFTRVTLSMKQLVGEVLYVDGFGNIITNIQTADLDTFAKDTVQVKLGSRPPRKIRLLSTYAEGEAREFFAVVGSHGCLELALNQGSAAERLTVKTGDKITLLKT
jgi:S-adenosylmethionine hydrolase